MSDLYAMVFYEKAQVWLVYDELAEKILGAAVTEIVQYPELKSLRVFLLGGRRMASWKDLLDEHFGNFCEAEGIDRIEVAGRKGFLVALESLGYNLLAIISPELAKKFKFLKLTQRGTAIYDRKDQIVAREIVVLEKN